MLTAHELARLLLDVPDFKVYVAVDDQYGLLSECEAPHLANCEPWQEDPDYMTTGDEPSLKSIEVIVLSPKNVA